MENFTLTKNSDLGKRSDESFNLNETTFTYTGIMRDKTGERIVYVSFERKGLQGREYAEGTLPNAKIIRQKGFSEAEIKQLEIYLKENVSGIMHKAKEITGIKHWFA